MTAPEGRRDRAQPVRTQFRRADVGTLLGALAWALGALQIMRDRGHAEEDEEFHELYDTIAPKLDRIIEQLNEARRSTMTHPRFEEPIEEAYAEVRAAFEAWIQLTATDTLAAAIGAKIDTEDGDDAAGADGATPDEDGGAAG